MPRPYKRKIPTIEQMRFELASERALNREMRKRLSSMRHELRSAKARLNDLVHFVAVARGSSCDLGGSGCEPGDGSAG